MNKFKLLYISFGLLFISFVFYGYSGGVASSANADATGSPFSGPTCGSCHSNGIYGTTFSIEIRDPSTGIPISAYEADSLYNVVFTVSTTTGSPAGFGFQSVALTDANSTNAGTFSNPSSNAIISTLSNNNSYAEHSAPSLSNVFTVDWLAPGSGTGSVTFYGAGNAVDNMGSTNNDKGTAGVTVNLNEIVPPSTDATLIDLTSGGTSVSGFDPDTLSYDVVLPFGTVTVPMVGATANDTNATVVITDASSLPGSTTIVVTAEDGIAMRTYAINYALGLSNDSRLVDLTVDGSTVAGFMSTVLSYSIELPFGTTTVPTVLGIPADTNATVDVMDATVLPGVTTLIVTAQDTMTTSTYTIDFTLTPPSDNADLSDLLVDGSTVEGFMSSDTSYLVALPANTVNVPVVTAVPVDTNASVFITDALVLPGLTTVEVTAEDGVTMKMYTVDFTILSSLDAIRADQTIRCYLTNNHALLNIRVPAPQNLSYNVKVFDLNGRILHSGQLQAGEHKQVDVARWAAGTYLVAVSSEAGLAIEKIVIQ